MIVSRKPGRWVRLSSFAIADCGRCGKPAFPTEGYCSRYCRECDEYDYESACFGVEPNDHRSYGYYKRIEAKGPVAAEESSDVWGELFDAMEADRAEVRRFWAGTLFFSSPNARNLRIENTE